MSPIALLLLLLISAADITVEAYPAASSPNEELSKTVNNDEAVLSRSGLREDFDMTSSESGVETAETELESRKKESDAPAQDDKKNDVNVRGEKEKDSKTKLKREADDPFKTENKISNEMNDATVKSDMDKPVTDEKLVWERNVKGKENSNFKNVSPSKGNVGKNALVNKNANNEGLQSEVNTGSQTANVEDSMDKNVKGRRVENSEVNGKDTVGSRLGEETQDNQEAVQSSAEETINPSDVAENSTDATKSSSSSSEESEAASLKSEAEPESASRLLVHQAVPISRVAFESDLESLSPELRALQRAEPSSLQNIPLVSEVIDDIRKRPMVSRIKYAKETLFPPVADRPSSDASNDEMQSSKMYINPYKEGWEFTSDPLMVKLIKNAASDFEHRIDPVQSAQRISSEEQLESPIPENQRHLINALMKKLESLTDQFSRVILFASNPGGHPDLTDPNGPFEWIVVPEHRYREENPSYSNSSKKLKTLSNELAAVRKIKKKLSGKDGVLPLSQKLSSKLAVNEAVEKSLNGEGRNYPASDVVDYRSPADDRWAPRSSADDVFLHRSGH